MKITKQLLAESSARELEESIRRNPLPWIDEILANINEPGETLRALVASKYYVDSEGPRTLIGELVEQFAVAAGQQVYDAIISHPGNIE